MMMSPSANRAASSSTVSPVKAAGTMTHAARGAVSLATKSSSEVAPVAPSPSSSSTDGLVDVEHDALVAVAHEAADQVGAHPPESDHAELHSPLLCFKGTW